MKRAVDNFFLSVTSLITLMDSEWCSVNSSRYIRPHSFFHSFMRFSSFKTDERPIGDGVSLFVNPSQLLGRKLNNTIYQLVQFVRNSTQLS